MNTGLIDGDEVAELPIVSPSSDEEAMDDDDMFFEESASDAVERATDEYVASKNVFYVVYTWEHWWDSRR